MNSGGTYIRIWLFLGMVLLNPFTTLYSQKTTSPTPEQLDSLYHYYDLSKADSLTLPKRLSYVTQSLALAKKWKHDSIWYNSLMQKTFLFGKQKQYDSAIAYTQQLYDLAKANRDTLYLKKALKKLGLYYKRKNQLKEAFQYYNESFKIARLNNDSIWAGNNLLYMANIQNSLGDYSGCKVTATEGLQFVEKTSDLRCIAGLYHICFKS
ncbi:tetratricopeptide repeat protein [Aquimarina algicola]|uniref:Tetratricopeptide repeat protein n=1 Tax=Aquimarina algicola TaxID=2589995 RepID=A0A504JLU5_9FLAO|nr:tetratricopeptide repeat protein [Aquimarina algicola]TPN87440.1 tetratricopeptide repeat protein [Aquimarina algicola]